MYSRGDHIELDACDSDATRRASKKVPALTNCLDCGLAGCWIIFCSTAELCLGDYYGCYLSVARRVSIVTDYFLHYSWTCDFPELPEGWGWTPIEVACFKKQLKKVFLVPMKRSTEWWEESMIKSQLIENLLGFLHQLLHHNTDFWWRGRRLLKVLEKELRFLHTIVEDLSWMLQHCDDRHYEAQFKNLMEEFEAVANQAGCFIHSMLFSTHDIGFQEMEELAAALHRIDCLNANLKSSDIFTATTSNNRRVSTTNSFLYLHSLGNDLHDMLQGVDDRIAEVKDQISLLHQKLMLLRFLINDTTSPQFSEIGNIALQAHYLITVFLAKDAPLWYVITRFTHLNQMIHVIALQLEFIKKYKLDDLKMTKNFTAIPPLQDERKINDSDEVMVGFEGEERGILNQLVGEGRPERLVISIMGMPGLGKTTLARKLYNLVRERFDKLSWIVVSQSYEIRRIMRDILIHINNDLGKGRILHMEVETLEEHIHKTLKGRRYLVVMDDIWDSNVWDELQRCLPDDGNGSRILLTSRDQSLAPPNSIILKLPFLSDEQCWELLQKKVFRNKTCSLQLQLMGKKIAAKCHGLPLTVSVIAGVLSSMNEEESAWEKVGESLASYVNEGADTVRQILELSYNHLPDHLKSCFLSFGAYKEDQEVSVEKLKRYWIAKGFICKENESMDNLAEEYIMELINRSLIMVAKKRLDGGVNACVVHDLLRDLSLEISQEERFWCWSDGLTFRLGSINVRALQRGCATLWLTQHEHSIYSDGQTSSYVRDMRLLRVLYFSRSDDNWDHHCSIFRVDYLINLRYLIIDKVPTWIENLLNLEYLTLEFNETVYLPPAIVKLKKLRYIHAYRVEYSEDWNSGGTSNNNLEYLSWVVIKKLKDEELLQCSSHLRKLKCTYELIKSSDLEESEYPRFDLSFLTQLHTLSLKLHRYHGFEFHEFRFPAYIRMLTLGWLMAPWEMMSTVGRLENLEVLKLCVSAFVGNIWHTRDGEFRNLRFLLLDNMFLHEWNVSSSEHFPRLQHLVLRDCHCLEEIPCEIGDIATLELIEVKGNCRDSLRESAERIKEEQLEMGNEELKVIVDAT